jgi:RNA polymerase sigma-70 factor, ECF subfamily
VNADRSAGSAEFAAALVDARSGGHAGLSVLFRSFHPPLLRYLRAHEPGRAEDIAGETWLAVAAQIKGFDGDRSAFAGWLFTIARNRLADLRRTGARRRTDPVAEVREGVAGSSTEDVVVGRLEVQAAVDLVVGQLSPDQAEVVLLRTLGGLSAAEVGRIMGRDEGWVRVTHHRAVRRLREIVLR